MDPMSEHLQVQREETAGPRGQKTAVLLAQAKAHAAEGRHGAAVTVCFEALSLQPEGSDDACAATVWHTLAVTLDSAAESGRRTARIEADHWFRKARACRARCRSHLRKGVTLYSHAACLRRRAHEGGPIDAEELINEAEGCLREAIIALETFGLVGIADAAATLTNLGNLLAEERRKYAEARRCYKRAVELAEMVVFAARTASDIEDTFGECARRTWRGARCGYIRMQWKAGDKRQVRDAIKQALGEADSPDLAFADDMVCLAAEMLLSTSRSEDRKRAREVLLRRRPDQAVAGRPMAVLHRARLLRRAELTDAARALLQDVIERAFVDRANVVLAEDADQLGRDAQLASYELADLELARGDAAQAFLWLENCAGLRFNDDFAIHAYLPTTLEASKLWARWARLTEEAAMIGHAEQLLRICDAAGWTDTVRTWKDQVAVAATSLDDADVKRSVARLVADLPMSSEKAPEFLEQHAARMRRDQPRALDALRTADPIAAAIWNAHHMLIPAALAATLELHPGVVALRVLGDADRILAIAAWYDGASLCTSSAVCPVTSPQLGALFEPLANQQPEQPTSIDAALAAINLPLALPAAMRARIVVLPSGWARGLAFAALRVDGSLLVDRFDSIVQMPSLAPLRHAPMLDRARQGSLVVVGPNVEAADIAFGTPLSDEAQFYGDDASEATLTSRLATVRTVTIMAHGTHAPYEEPTLQVAGEEPLQPSISWRGLERVELWACSSGTFLPSSPLAVDSDEGTGLDHAFLSFGVRSAIGTLWPVSELATALIARNYRSGLSDGLAAPAALVAAQRWWRAQAAPQLIEAIRRDSDIDLQAVVRQLAGSSTCQVTIERLLGPIPASKRTGQAENLLSSATMWAGFRFIGWDRCEEVAVIVPDLSRDLAAEDIPPLEHRARPMRLADAIDARLDDLYTEIDQKGDPAKFALEAGMLYALRWSGAHDDNLLRGLAWLHDTLAGPGLPSGTSRTNVELLAVWL